MPDLSRLHRLAAGEGWDALEEAQSQLDDERRKIEALEAQREADHRAMVRRALSTDDGRALLAWLRRETVDHPARAEELGATTAEHFAIVMARRQGMDMVVRKLVEFLEPDTEPAPTEDPTR